MWRHAGTGNNNPVVEFLDQNFSSTVLIVAMHSGINQCFAESLMGILLYASWKNLRNSQKPTESDMLCEVCGKKEATVHLTEIVNDKVAKLNICEDCAKDKGAEMEEHFGLSDLLAGLADMGSKAEPENLVSIKCPSCGFSYSDFKKVGRLGCGDCYETFKAKLRLILSHNL